MVDRNFIPKVSPLTLIALLFTIVFMFSLLTENTKQKAYEALKLLNQQFAGAMSESADEHGDHGEVGAEAA